MGVPAFFRWLSEKYPKIVQDVLEERVPLAAGSSSIPAPFDCTRPNPSGLECDHLYIDMNGIIHPCSHPEQGPQPNTEEEMFENVCHYVDRLFRVMRPRKLLYLAIDGVAPRAKMNQQRARRFRSAQEARENMEVEEAIREELKKKGQAVPPAKKAWDSNVITPGTPFMLKLSEYLRFYIRKRISSDKAWKDIRVIFSDASIPGEGEHKIMDHVRRQRSQPGYSPNNVHVLHGLDADLIMLALATHEAHFYISREEVIFGRKSQEQTEQRQLESGFRDAQRQLDEQVGDSAMQLLENRQKPLCRVSIPILRDYLAADFASCIAPDRLPFTPSFERLIDDVVFLLFFCGNDFLPHLPSLDIRDGAVDFLFNVYKRILPTLGDYITNHGGQVNLSHVDVILAEVGAIEDYVFEMKHSNEQREKERRAHFKARKKQAGGRSLDAPPLVVTNEPRVAVGRAARILEKNKKEAQPVNAGKGGAIKASHMKAVENKKVAEKLKNVLVPSPAKKETKPAPVPQELTKTSLSGSKRKSDDTKSPGSPKKQMQVGDIADEDDDEDDEDEVVVVDDAAAKAFKERVKAAQQKQLDDYSKNIDDKVRLHEPGWKDRYYTDKCKADDVAAHGGREHMFRSYVMGLCWVMRYYYAGCPSWKWYYPFHYAPFASDLRNIDRFQQDCKSFEQSTPFNPVEQLMAVLPSDSSHAIPKEARWLMLDGESPIIDFYPRDVPVDPNGKAMPWLWVVLLPFIEEERLLGAMMPTMAKWTKQELLCNARGLDDGYLYVHTSHPLTQKLRTVLMPGKTAKSPKARLTDTAAYGCPGFTGAIRPPLSNEMYNLDEEIVVLPPSASSKATLGALFAEEIPINTAVCVSFSEPMRLSHKSILLPGATPPPSILTADDRNIRKPRLNRGGATIANLGTGNGQSFKSGYGSMNVGTFERQLAEKTGRGAQMQQTGMRAWGAMEPAPKRRYQAPNPLSNPQGHGRGRPQTANGRPPWQNHPQASGNFPPPPPPPPPSYPPHRSSQQQQQSRHQYQPRPAHTHGGQSSQWQANHQNPQPNYHRQHHQQNNHHQQQRQQQNRSQNQRAPSNPIQNNAPQRPQGHNFRSLNQTQRPGHSFRAQQQQQQQQPPPRQSTLANSSVMSSLKAQLANTLKQSKRKSGGK